MDLNFDEVIDTPQIRNFAEILQEKQNVEGHETLTTNEQKSVEADVLPLYQFREGPILLRQHHIRFLKKSIIHLSKCYESLDCSKPWLCYWILHSLTVLGERLENAEYSKIAKFLAKCQSPNGGFGGGPGQYPHLATTYAAVNALCIIGTQEAYDVIDRKGLQQFLLSLRGEDNSFCIHANGEIDMRGAYCALVVAKLTNVYTQDMFKGTDEWIVKCQTWEGGFGGCPGMEAHGGYTYCGLAALVLLGKTHLCRLPPLLRWLVNKQMRLEGGFQGRTNKLVDACYSFWLGGAFSLIHPILSKEDKTFNSNYWLFDQGALQEYLLDCCQNSNGGLGDKPGKIRDIYHTCYALSGLSVAQNSPQSLIIGPKVINKLEIIHPVYNLVNSAATKALIYFGALPIPD